MAAKRLGSPGPWTSQPPKERRSQTDVLVAFSSSLDADPAVYPRTAATLSTHCSPPLGSPGCYGSRIDLSSGGMGHDSCQSPSWQASVFCQWQNRLGGTALSVLRRIVSATPPCLSPSSLSVRHRAGGTGRSRQPRTSSQPLANKMSGGRYAVRELASRVPSGRCFATSGYGLVSVLKQTRPSKTSRCSTTAAATRCLLEQTDGRRGKPRAESQTLIVAFVVACLPLWSPPASTAAAVPCKRASVLGS